MNFRVDWVFKGFKREYRQLGCTIDWFELFESNMRKLKKIDLFVGVKAEQSLRELVRAHADNAGVDDTFDLELTPVGRKDWIAGKRYGNSLVYGELQQVEDDVLASLIGLESSQRIRRETIRVYAVAQPVPVFKESPSSHFEIQTEPEPKLKPETPAQSNKGCPICHRDVHSYNLQYDTSGKVVGCFMCGGDPQKM